MKTCSGVASDATSVATRRSERCSCASWPISASFASGSPPSALVLLLRVLRAVGQVDARRDEIGGQTVFARHRPVRPGDQAALAVLRLPVADLGAGVARLPDVGQHLAERVGLLARDDEVEDGPPEHLLAAEPARPFARVVEEQEPPLAVECADERLRRLREHRRERPAEGELSGTRLLLHRRRMRVPPYAAT